MFVLNKTRLIKYKKVVYFLEQIRKEFTKELYKKLTTRYLRIKKTKDIVIAYYYFPNLILRPFAMQCSLSKLIY
jgi:hypothetical protein